MESISERENLKYWDDFYKKTMIDGESTFCSFVKQHLKCDKKYLIFDIGCGSGRDTKAFAKDGYEILGIDRSKQVIQTNNDLTKNIESIEFVNIDVGLPNELLNFLKHKKNLLKEEKNIFIYSRFFLHSINEETEEILFNTLSEGLTSGDRMAFEFRTIEDEKICKYYDNHYRRFINLENLISRLTTKYSFKVDFSFKGQSLSVFNGEDPYLGRIVCSKI